MSRRPGDLHRQTLVRTREELTGRDGQPEFDSDIRERLVDLLEKKGSPTN